MRIVVIGGTGHVGAYLVPRLVEAGHQVISLSRGQREPYHYHEAWESVEQVQADRSEEEARGTFGRRILAVRPDAVIDMICFREDSARHITEALRDNIQHFLYCGTIWVHGHSVQAPTTESQARMPFGEYGTRKAAIEAYLLDQARKRGFPATVIHPGHIVGPGWPPLNPAGNFNPAVFATLARGETLALPNLGMETVHHVHADDVAQMFQNSLNNWSASVGESFHAVSPAAVTLRGFAETAAGWFGQTAGLSFLPWDAWASTVSDQDAACTLDHISHSPNCSIAKAERLIGYKPRYTSFQAVRESVDWLVKNKVIHI